MNLYRLTNTAKNANLWAIPARSEVRRVAESAASDPDNQQSLRQQLAETGAENSALDEGKLPSFADLVAQLRDLGELSDRLLKHFEGEVSAYPRRHINEEV